MYEDMNAVLSEFAAFEADPPAVRKICEKCRRPAKTCWCSYLPVERLAVSTTVCILQHPFEETRNLQTGPMLMLGLQEGRFCRMKGKRFPIKRFPKLESIIRDPHTLLLWPGRQAVDLVDFVNERHTSGLPDVSHTLVLLDGTWQQARALYTQNPFLHSLKQVKLSNFGLSEYVIRTQPLNGCLSTVETAALAISILENRPDVYQALIRPLQALCDYQLNHGAVKHHSKQFLIENGLYVKQQKKSKGDRRQQQQQQPQQQPLDVDTARQTDILSAALEDEHFAAETDCTNTKS